nr:MAG TPA: hypothetical protein [Caudoviricetes sp.]
MRSQQYLTIYGGSTFTAVALPTEPVDDEVPVNVEATVPA